MGRRRIYEPTSRACLDGAETGMHLLVSCRAAACRAARRRFFDGVLEFASTASSRVGDFLMRSLTIDDDGQLLCDGDAAVAFGLVTGFWPAGLRMALWADDGCDDDISRGRHSPSAINTMCEQKSSR